jgi:hypothetical protein
MKKKKKKKKREKEKEDIQQMSGYNSDRLCFGSLYAKSYENYLAYKDFETVVDVRDSVICSATRNPLHRREDHPIKYYMRSRRHDLNEEVECWILDSDPEKKELTIYLPKYDQERVIDGTMDNLSFSNIYPYDDPTTYGTLTVSQFERLIIRNFGERHIGKIKKVIPNISYEIRVNRKTLHISADQMYAYSYELPGLVYPKNGVKCHNNLVGKYVAIDLIDGLPNHSMLLDDRLARILTTKS